MGSPSGPRRAALVTRGAQCARLARSCTHPGLPPSPARPADRPLPRPASEEGAGSDAGPRRATSCGASWRRLPRSRRRWAMPMPHRTFAQLAKRRLVGKEGRERIREVQSLLAELPDYKNGPYADLRKTLLAEIEDTRVRSKAVHRDSIAVRREGAAQIALVGPPNVGKSSVLQALSEIQIKTGDYAFTTLRPVPALTRIGGVLVQLVEIPGLISGASDDRGGGRPLLGVLRSADAIVYCVRASGDPAELETVISEVSAAEIEKPSFIAATRADEASEEQLAGLRARFDGLDVLPVSVLDDDSLEALCNRIWALTGLIRIYLRKDGDVALEPLALTPPATVIDVADAVHHDLAASFIGARLWGPSARFEGQRVGRDQTVQDGDTVEILA